MPKYRFLVTYHASSVHDVEAESETAGYAIVQDLPDATDLGLTFDELLFLEDLPDDAEVENNK